MVQASINQFCDVLSWKARFSVAPMMAWTDRHCRFFHRQISDCALLYTEMVTAAALVHGGAIYLLDHHVQEHPVAVQLGGSDPKLLQEATKISVDTGYSEVNLNVGCPSDRVQSGAFGAALMKNPDGVVQCVEAMQKADGATITVKCRIGVDEQNPYDVLPDFLSKLQSAGIRRVIIHARMAWLQGLSPKDNREIPPLNYDLVHQMKADFPEMHLSINGGLETTQDALGHIVRGLDGAMVGRAAYHNPYDVLSKVDQMIFNQDPVCGSDLDVAEKMTPYIAHHIETGGRMHQVTRHMLGLFAGKPGARHWRRSLSELGAANAGVAEYEILLEHVRQFQKDGLAA